MTIDIFNAPTSVIVKGLKGKVVSFIGGNNLGKTYQSTQLEKPLHLSFERSLAGIGGVKYQNIQTWADFKKVNKQLTSKSTIEKAQEVYSTIIFDEVYAAAQKCQDFVLSKWGAEHMGERVDNAPNFYQEYEKEFFREINKLIGAGYTVVFIFHTEQDSDGKWQPKGDKRSVKPIIDNTDLALFLQSNGLDENGQERLSTAWTVETDKFFARSKFKHMPTHLPEFTAEALEKAVKEALEKEESEGVHVMSYEEYTETNKEDEITFDEIKKLIAQQLKDLTSAILNKNEGSTDNQADVEKAKTEATKILVKSQEDNLGKGRTLKDVTEGNMQQLDLILEDLKTATKSIA